MLIQLLHPITHDGIHYGRGVVDVNDATAKTFMAIRHSGPGGAQSSIAIPFKQEAIMAEVKKAPDFQEPEAGDPEEKQQPQNGKKQNGGK